MYCPITVRKHAQKRAVKGGVSRAPTAAPKRAIARYSNIWLILIALSPPPYPFRYNNSTPPPPPPPPPSRSLSCAHNSQLMINHFARMIGRVWWWREKVSIHLQLQNLSTYSVSEAVKRLAGKSYDFQKDPSVTIFQPFRLATFQTLYFDLDRIGLE
ncbi:hypothetical protein ACTXT7_013535 [Hymenolepis weldensis]